MKTDTDKGLRVLRLSASARERLRDDLNMECSMRMGRTLADEFISLGRLLRLPRGRAIIRAGEFDDNLYVLVEGIMRIWRTDCGREVTDAFGLPATLVLSHHCYDQGRPSAVNYEACTPCKLLRVARADYDALRSVTCLSPCGTCAWPSGSSSATRNVTASLSVPPSNATRLFSCRVPKSWPACPCA